MYRSLKSEQRFQEWFPEFIAELDSLQNLIDAVFGRNEYRKTGRPDTVVIGLGYAILEDFLELMLLCENGYGLGGAKILRGLYERVVTVAYISKYPTTANDFIDFDAVNRWKLFESLPEAVRKQFFAEDTVNAHKREYERVRHRFLNHKGDVRDKWSGKNLLDLAKDVQLGLPERYVPSFKLSSLHIHATFADVIHRIDTHARKFRPVTSSSRTYISSVLTHAHYLLLCTLSIESKHFGLELQDRIDAAFVQYNQIWK